MIISSTFFPILVFATDETKEFVVSSSRSISVSRPAMPLKVSCPIVAEPNVEYKCGFSSIPGSGLLPISFLDADEVEVTAYESEPPCKI